MEELLKSLDSDLVLIKAVVGEETIELHAKKDTVEGRLKRWRLKFSNDLPVS
jgi:hypothetical protein